MPFAAVALVLPQGAIRWYALGVLVLSLAHQPVTLGLVYADPHKRRARPRFFLWTPVVLGVAILVGQAISFTLVAIVGGLWNTEHTLMQRYGLVRIHRRRAGDHTPGSVDLWLLASWLLLVLAWAVRDTRTPDRIDSLGLGTANQRSLQLLVDIRPVATALVVGAAAAAAWATWRWVANQRSRGFAGNAGLFTYVGATAALFVVAMVHPVAGLLAWVGAHAVEYFLIVDQSLAGRTLPVEGSPSLLDRASATRWRAVAFVAATSAAGAGAVVLAQFHAPLTVYGLVFFGIGGLHILYDGVIWKLRRPEVARSLAIDVAAPAEAVR